MKGKSRRPANKLQSPGTGEVHHVCQSILTSASYTHPPQGVPAQAGPLGSLPCGPLTSPSALARAYYYGTVCCQVLLDGWLRPSPDPYGPSETNLPCMSSHPVEAGAAGARAQREHCGLGSLSQCDNIGWQCILQSVPGAVCAVVCCARHSAADGEFCSDPAGSSLNGQMRPIPTNVQQGCAVRLDHTPHHGSIQWS